VEFCSIYDLVAVTEAAFDASNPKPEFLLFDAFVSGVNSADPDIIGMT
jgi:hypothetical protein